MTEDDAKAWVAERWSDRAVEKLEQFRTLVLVEATRQNLISPSTFDALWSRHIVDSAQLVPLAGSNARNWLDVGTGAGFPGVIVAILLPETSVTLVEPRKRRADFLAAASETLDLQHVLVRQVRSQQLNAGSHGVISARAVSTLTELLAMTAHLRSPATKYLLPKGRSAAAELETLPAKWQGLFHVEQSITDSQSSILVGAGVT